LIFGSGNSIAEVISLSVTNINTNIEEDFIWLVKYGSVLDLILQYAQF